MKILYLARHAKSSWQHTGLKDIERPLNRRGENDAPFIGNLLNEKGAIPDLLITSPAVRAKSTAFAIAEQIKYPKDKIIIEDNIYEASSNELLKIIYTINEKYNSVLIFGHNPGLTMLNNFLSNNYIENIPTCGITGIRLNSSWKEAGAGKGKSLLFIYPKMFLK